MSDTVLAGAKDRTRDFYVGMGWLCLGIATLGFVPTFFVPLAHGTFHRPPAIYIHAVLFFAWPVYFAAQAWLAANGRRLAHREWGILGAALATAMVTGVVVISVMRLNEVPQPITGPGSPAFEWIHYSGMTYFGACIVGAFAKTRRPETHKRLMLIATFSLLEAPIARWAQPVSALLHGGAAPAAPGPEFAIVFIILILVATMPFFIAMAFDKKRDGKISPIYSVGLAVYVTMIVTQNPFGQTPLWLSIAGAIKRLAS